MMSKFAFVFPGQGAQKVGMGQALAESAADAKAVFETFDRILADVMPEPFASQPLSQVCFNGPEETLTRTLYTQPAILATSLAAWTVFNKHYPDIQPSITAGHSLGEYGALVAAGVLTVEDAARLIAERARLMDLAENGAMTAVIGLGAEKIDAVLADYKQANPEAIVALANDNSPEQQVISGQPDAVAAVEPLLKDAGARRVIPLTVGGAFHSPLMTPAANEFKQFLTDKPFANATMPVITNVDASLEASGEQFRQKLAQQIDHSVRWTETMATLQAEGVTHVLEFGPGNVLCGLFRKFDRTLNTHAIGCPDTLTQAKAMIEKELTPA